MKTFEDKLHASAQRLVAKDNRRMHVPQNPLFTKKAYWGWVATPAAAVVGIVLGLSMHSFMNNEPDIRYVQQTDTLRIVRPVHDTLYLTQIVEKERIVNKYMSTPEVSKADVKESNPQPEECTSIQCDGINYAILASN